MSNMPKPHWGQILLKDWCEKLLALQISNPAEPGLDGGILCPACGRIHGRCFDAIYPFLYLADSCKDERFLLGAKKLFSWAEQNVSLPDGSYLNDLDCDWQGTTVFTVIQMCQALKHHGHLLDIATKQAWTERLRHAAEFLFQYKALEHNNINYPVANILALHLCGTLLGQQEYIDYGRYKLPQILSHITPDGILFGEGVPSEEKTLRGCRPVDIGYNVEESLPALTMYAVITEHTELEQRLVSIWERHLQFLLPDGGWDNSFGTRNYKWSYWGSRTTDGCALGLLLLARYNPSFSAAAWTNLKFLKLCTRDGLLCGGPHYPSAGERTCVHHTFTHAKVLAELLDLEFFPLPEPEPFYPPRQEGIVHDPVTDTCLINLHGMLADITAYDWEYLPGGHTSGGNLSLLWHKDVGPIFCASMGQYQNKEPANQQLPRQEHHLCLSPSINWKDDNILYSSFYDYECGMSWENREDRAFVTVTGQLFDIRHVTPKIPIHHTSQYSFCPNGLSVHIEINSSEAAFHCPVISEAGETIRRLPNQLTVEKKKARVILTIEQGKLTVPLGEKRCYNLVPGFQAVPVIIHPDNGHIHWSLHIDPL